jgi:Tetratricopeptide repeat.
MLAIAYHNLGVEEDFCKHYEAAIESYTKALNLIEEHGGPQDPLYAKFKEAVDEATEVQYFVSNLNH